MPTVFRVETVNQIKNTEGVVSSGRGMSLPNTFASCEQVRGAAPSIPLSSDEDSWNPASFHCIFGLSVFQMLETAVVIYKQQVAKDTVHSGGHGPSISAEVCVSRRMGPSCNEGLNLYMAS